MRFSRLADYVYKTLWYFRQNLIMLRVNNEKKKTIFYISIEKKEKKRKLSEKP